MATKELTEYVCDMDSYRAMWKVPVAAGAVYVAIPFILVGLIVLALVLVG